jgi:hypothetical protein
MPRGEILMAVHTQGGGFTDRGALIGTGLNDEIGSAAMIYDASTCSGIRFGDDRATVKRTRSASHSRRPR